MSDRCKQCINVCVHPVSMDPSWIIEKLNSGNVPFHCNFVKQEFYAHLLITESLYDLQAGWYRGKTILLGWHVSPLPNERPNLKVLTTTNMEIGEVQRAVMELFSLVPPEMSVPVTQLASDARLAA